MNFLKKVFFQNNRRIRITQSINWDRGVIRRWQDDGGIDRFPQWETGGQRSDGQQQQNRNNAHRKEIAVDVGV